MKINFNILKFKKIKNKKGMELAVNTVVMIILGIFIFSLGMALFMKVYNTSQSDIDDLNNKIKTNIATLECNDDEWICSPSYEISRGEKKTFVLFVANLGEEKKDFKIKIGDEDSNRFSISNDCGEIEVGYLKDYQFSLNSGTSAQVPFFVIANKIKKVPCTFIISAKLIDFNNGDLVLGKTPIIIKVK
jgi:hypothetical protein